jgi:pyruvate carboxylase
VFQETFVANRGKITVRAFRAAHNSVSVSVAVLPFEHHASEHRIRADEAYQIGERAAPGPDRAVPHDGLEGRRLQPGVAEFAANDLDGLASDRRAMLNRLRFPGPTEDFLAAQTEFGASVSRADRSASVRAAAGRRNRGRGG